MMSATDRIGTTSQAQEVSSRDHQAPQWSKFDPESYFPSIEKKYGRSIQEWQDISRSFGPGRHMELVNRLKQEYGIGHGHANALVGYTVARSPHDAS